MKKLLSIFLMIAILMMPLACTAEETTGAVTGTEAVYDHLTIGIVTPLSGDFFTGMWGSNTSDIDVRELLHGYALTGWDNETATFQPDPSVVTGITATENSSGDRTYTVVIADDLMYSDGSPITAADYVFSILLSVAPEMKAIGADTETGEYIYGIDEYVSGEAAALSGVRLINDTTFSMTIKAEYEPYFYELNYLAYSPYPVSVIAPGCEVADDGDGVYIRNIEEGDPLFTAELLEQTILDPDTGYKTHPSVVSGPYTLTSYDADAHTAEFELNPYYKGNADGVLPGVETLTVVPVTNTDMLEKLQSGDVDLINKVVMADTISEGIELANTDEYDMQNYTRSGLSFIAFNCERPGISSEAVREAIYMCLDKDTLLQEATGSYGIAVNGYYGIGQWMYQIVNGTLELPEDESDAGDTAEEQLSMDAVPVYTFDTEAATEKLIADGWTLNENGTDFDAATDTVRCRLNDAGELEKLSFKLVIADTSTLTEALNDTFTVNLAKAGIELTTETVPAGELFSMYYNAGERDYDMALLASNFSAAYDPSPLYAYTTDEEGNTVYGESNYCGIADEELYELALELRQTEPGDILTYCQRWVAFQTRWADVLPAIPLYSNVYFDFYTATLHDYDVRDSVGWPEAVSEAYMGDAVTVEEEESTESADSLESGESEEFETIAD